MSKIIVIGGGAAGMMAAISAAENGHQVILLEKNEKLGKKLFITGKGRCNITNDSEVENLLAHVVSNPKFLYSAFYSFTSQQMMDFLETEGLALKTERGNRVFPASDKSSDVIRTLQSALVKRGVLIRLQTEVKELIVEEKTVRGVRVNAAKRTEKILGDAVIIATGGVSYPSTGSTGDGYQWAEETGHQVTNRYPALVPVEVREDYAKELQGLSLRNVVLRCFRGEKVLFEELGELLFTHFGVSGPLVLSASSILSGKELNQIRMEIDLKPALTEEQLDDRILRDFQMTLNSQFKNSLHKLLPSKLIPVMVALSQIPPEKLVNEITKQERRNLLRLLKAFPLTPKGLRGYNEAIITKGGVSVKSVNPATMESRCCKGIYFAGEVLDLDAVTGGYNLQIAWSTGYLAGISVE